MLKSQKPHIGIFGRRNVGKSSCINAITGQDAAIVSAIAGTTTDPVTRSHEITGLGPVMITDTAGIDDTGELGEKRIAKTTATFDAVDLGILVIAENTFAEPEQGVLAELTARETPVIILHNKSDLATITTETRARISATSAAPILDFCATAPKNLEELRKLLIEQTPPSAYHKPSIVGDLVEQGQVVLLVTPIDVQAPEGRLILPQVQTIRDCLDNDCAALIVKERELDAILRTTGIQPALVVTDSQAFLKVDASIPHEIPLTSFSILFARLKGDFEHYLAGTPAIATLSDDDRVMILESCSHHVAGDDIGRVKIPRWISSFTGRKLHFDVVAGMDRPPHPIESYKLVIQCGGCMLTRKQVLMRLKPALDRNIPVTNYGMAIAFCLGIYDRAVAPFLGKSASRRNYL